MANFYKTQPIIFKVKDAQIVLLNIEQISEFKKEKKNLLKKQK
jgi:hypothetical protein